MTSLDYLPLEIKWAILDNCDAKTLTNMLAVSRCINVLTKGVMTARLRRIILFPTEGVLNNRLVISTRSPDTESMHANTFEYCFEKEETNEVISPANTFHEDYSTLSDSDVSSLSRVSSRGSSITSIDMDEYIDNGNENVRKLHKLREEEFLEYQRLTVKSRFVQLPQSHHGLWSTSPIPNEHYCAWLDIKPDDYYGSLNLSVGLLLPGQSSQKLLFTTNQRIDSDWWMEDEYIVHNKEVSYRLQVERTARDLLRNKHGDLVNRYGINISEVFFNTGYLLDRIESLQEGL